MMSDAMDVVPAGLPVATKEKVTRWAFYIGTGALAVAAINTFMPSINKALSLMGNGVWNLTELALAGAVAAGPVLAVIIFWPLYKRVIESLANKPPWALFEYDPITPVTLG